MMPTMANFIRGLIICLRHREERPLVRVIQHKKQTLYHPPFFLTGIFSVTEVFTITSTGLDQSSTNTIGVRAVPGPIVGAGLPGLIMACGGLIGLARRRRRKQQ